MSFRGTTPVPVRWHIVHQGERGQLPDSQLKAQMATLNKIYAPTGLQFKTIDVELNDNPRFTPQQFQRVRDMVGYYRYKLNPQTARSSQLEQLRATLE